MNIPVADFHCDVLMKLLEDNKLSFQEDATGQLDVTLQKLKQSGAVFQTFAIFTSLTQRAGIEPVLESIDLFHRQVLTNPEIQWVRSKEDLKASISGGRIGAMLSIEGMDRLNGNPAMLRSLYELGVRAAGFTWNNANWAADGAMEERGAGLTAKGKEFVRLCDELGILLDVSHLSERAFWDMADTASRTILASHSNASSILPHKRNLSDDQIKAIIALQGVIGVTYVPYFVSGHSPVTIEDLLRHIERICELGGEQHVMLGSDFDGIEVYIDQLTGPQDVQHLQDALLKRYSEEQVRRFMSGNAIRFLLQHLPDGRS
ncbi:dipeptidase [Paenibacillus protaetiae]|uniref:Membrane dipeptidase n=1 Tax=Paenibacillus protaetiae TaxID=2509456 RepID=A0A4P6ERZ9_9BACL|nr:dipeptidase [Paenibacillus protaetiae]QAY65664.1 membrane dipeptidase [Paenibacillus protaetiae]